MTETLYRIITCTRHEGCNWEGSSEAVAIGDAEAEAAWDAAVEVAQLRERHPGRLLCGHAVRVLVEGAWVPVEDDGWDR